MDDKLLKSVVSAFSDEEKAWYLAFTDKEHQAFEEGISKLILVTDLPGRIMLSSTHYEAVNISSPRWMIEFSVGLKKCKRSINLQEFKLQKNYLGVVKRIIRAAVVF